MLLKLHNCYQITAMLHHPEEEEEEYELQKQGEMRGFENYFFPDF